MTKITREEAARLMINKELEKYGVDFDYVMVNQRIQDRYWFSYYTFDSKEEYTAWKDYCIDLLIHSVKPKYTKKAAEQAFMWIDMMWGLRCNYEMHEPKPTK